MADSKWLIQFGGLIIMIEAEDSFDCFSHLRLFLLLLLLTTNDVQMYSYIKSIE